MVCVWLRVLMIQMGCGGVCKKLLYCVFDGLASTASGIK